jgi:hypothetical protein
MASSRHCEPTDRANARPMTGSAKQSIPLFAELWIASSQELLAMTVVRTVTNSTRRANQFPILRNRVKPQNQKYFASQFGKSEVQLIRPVPIEGRIAIVTLRRPRDAVDAERQARLESQGGMNPVSDYPVRDRRMTLLAYGEAVWSWRPLLALNRRRRCGLDRARKTSIRR